MDTLTPDELNALDAIPAETLARLQQEVLARMSTGNLVAFDREVLKRWYEQEEQAC